MVAIGVLSMSAKDTYSRDVKVLPESAQTVLKNNFKVEVSHIKIDKDRGRVSEYDVILTDRSDISFYSDSNWKDVEVGAVFP